MAVRGDELPALIGNSAFTALVRGGMPASALLGRAPIADKMGGAADQAEKERLTQGPQSAVAKMDIIRDLAGAELLRREVLNQQDLIEKAVSEIDKGDASGNVTEQTGKENNEALALLDRFVENAGVESGTLGAFGSEVAAMEADYVRLIAEIGSYASTRQGAGTDDRYSDDQKAQATHTGELEIKSTGVRRGEFRAVSTAPGPSPTATFGAASQKDQTNMHDAGLEVSTSLMTYRATERRALQASAHLDGVLAKLKEDEVEASISNLKKRAQEAREKIEWIGEILSKAAGLAGFIHEEAVGDIAESSTGILAKLVEPLANQFDEEIEALQGGLGAIKAKEERAAVTEAVNGLEASKIDLVEAAQKFYDANDKLRRAQELHRSNMSLMGESADKAEHKGDRFEVLAKLLGEADAFVERADATLAVGKQEVDDAKNTEKSSAKIAWRGPGTAELSWWKIETRYSFDTGKPRPGYWAGERPLRIHRYEGEQTEQAVPQAIRDLKEIRDQVKAHADELRTAFK